MPAEPPTMRLQRPRTSPCLRPRRLSSRQATSASEDAGADSEIQEEEPITELLEYEWPDLPPLSKLKDGVTRSRVRHGISYLLPVDKGRNSINSWYRTDLRAMFQEPYARDDFQYDDNLVKLSSKVHFLSNSSDTKWTRQHLASVPVNLNSESEKTRRLYARSAPTGGRASQRMGIDPHKLRTRSNLYLPLKAAVPPEMVKLRQEVEDILKSVQENEDFEEQQVPDDTAKSEGVGPGGNGDHSTRDQPGEVGVNLRGREGSVVQGAQPLAAKLQSLRLSSYRPYRFSSYDELKASKPQIPEIPEVIKSQFLTDEQNQEIWEWLHHGEKMDDFQFFLSICG